jgi:hypothetical protein
MVKYLITILLLSPHLHTFAQTGEVKIPKNKGKYSSMAQQLESGQTDIDYLEFRNLFLKKQSKTKNRMHNTYVSLKKSMMDAAQNNDYPKVIEHGKAMLAIDYTSLYAHKFIQQTYKILGDSANYKKYHDIEFGLLNSITRNGDGKSCETGWRVVQIEEEYFLLYAMNVTLQRQALRADGPVCDVMTGTNEDGKEVVYFFKIGAFFKKY